MATQEQVARAIAKKLQPTLKADNVAIDKVLITHSSSGFYINFYLKYPEIPFIEGVSLRIN